MLINIETLQEEEIMGRETLFPEVTLQSHYGKSYSTSESTKEFPSLGPGLLLSKLLQGTEEPPQAASAGATALLMCPLF